ncbi:penicillin-binding transpeptidase domain-containing protein [Sphingobium estronivorans]|uniref:penicillin-binding transpeptidase domain-containing protein n=1 Tax=Sphingobium estronivorans TaxID=1577690 RepID=UPI00123C5B7F|nr:transglycosylase domain-containing protein [Sphingobium estronivorans]
MTGFPGTAKIKAGVARRATDLGAFMGRRWWNHRWLKVAFIGTLVFLLLAVLEMRTSYIQSQLFSHVAGRMHFSLGDGANDDIVFPGHGPFNRRLGYARLPDYIASLTRKGYAIEKQARPSPTLRAFQNLGGFPPYREKASAGLTLIGDKGRPIFSYRDPAHVYASYMDVPDLAVRSLLFVENRELLNLRHPRRNPAVEWDRLGLALVSFGTRADGERSPGGSTIATQMEKLRHSPEGRTTGAIEKLRQMTSASLRAYNSGLNTIAFRKQTVVDALNLIPLAGFPGHGEVTGLGDGLQLWYGADFASVNRTLRGPVRSTSDWGRKGLALKQVLSLVIAQRRPAYYLGKGRTELEALTESYLRLMASEGVIQSELGDAAIAARLRFNRTPPVPAPLPDSITKAANALRLDLAKLIKTPSFYDLHRLDLTVDTAIDKKAQEEATALLRSLKQPGRLSELGLIGPRLLAGDAPAQVNYSFTLYERGPDATHVRIRTDSLDGPLDVNAGTKLELGSTAKVRTLITYLDIVADLHGKLKGQSTEQLTRLSEKGDALTAWVAGQLLEKGDVLKRGDGGLAAIIDAAMEKEYSAGTGERFFTAGGMHRFANFSRRDGGMMTVSHALQQSVNLVFIRMMRDIVDYHIARIPGTEGILENPDHPARREYLRRFIDMEGRQYLARFLPAYRDLGRAAILTHVAERAKYLRPRLAAAFRTVLPQGDFDQFSAFIRRWAAHPPTDDEGMRDLYETYAPDRLDLADRSYIADIHPLELWLAGYLYAHPGASWRDIVAAGADVRQESYRWLLKPNRFAAQNRRIRTMLEQQAFIPIHKDWQRVGYPFDALIPSYATAIGTSGDRPDALAELMGIIASGGYRLAPRLIERLHFAEGTPYETIMTAKPEKGERVLRPEIAAAVRRGLIDVVENGTARRAYEAVVGPDGKVIAIGGKTGTGDNREQRYGSGHRLVGSEARSRTATFAFFIGDRYFGTVTAFVEGSAASHYRFTSALPAQLFKLLAPVTEQVIRPAANSDRAEPEKAAEFDWQAALAQPHLPGTAPSGFSRPPSLLVAFD